MAGVVRNQSRDWCVIYREYVIVKRLETLRVMAAYWSRAPTEQQWEVYMDGRSSQKPIKRLVCNI